MTVTSIIALFAIMTVLAAIPSVSVLTVSVRAAAYGFMHGMFTSLGIVAADVLFILIAVFGLSLLADSLGNWFDLVKYLGGVYLICLGVFLFRSKSVNAKPESIMGSSLGAGFMAGFFITLGDQKAILFYLGFLPAFMDLSSVSLMDTAIIILVASVSIMIAKLSYAYFGGRLGAYFKTAGFVQVMNQFVGSIMLIIGLFVLIRTWVLS